MKAGRYYPESKVEIQGILARFYDSVLNLGSFGMYGLLLKRVVADMGIQPGDKIIDFGAGTGKNALVMNQHLAGQGKIVGLDISDEMIRQFERKTKNFPHLTIKKQRIDIPFDTEERFDKVFISFVLHGFPFEIQKQIIRNAWKALKPGGAFLIFDFNEFDPETEPFYFRIPFKKLECKYAFEYIKRDWKGELSEVGFGDFVEKLYFRNRIRLLRSIKRVP